jgi:hypothetical protein
MSASKIAETTTAAMMIIYVSTGLSRSPVLAATVPGIAQHQNEEPEVMGQRRSVWMKNPNAHMPRWKWSSGP